MLALVLVSALVSGNSAYPGVFYFKRGADAIAEAKSKPEGEAQLYYDGGFGTGQDSLGDYYDYSPSYNALGSSEYQDYNEYVGGDYPEFAVNQDPSFSPEYVINQEPPFPSVADYPDYPGSPKPTFASGVDYPEYAINQESTFPSGADYPDYPDYPAVPEANFQTSFNNHTSATTEQEDRSSQDHTIHHEGSLSTMREINGTLDSIKELLQRTIENDPLPTLLEINSTLDMIKGLLSTEDDPLRNISEINQDLDAIKSLLKTIRQNQSQPPPRAIVNSAPAQVVDLRTGSTSSRRRPSPRPKTSTGRRRGSFLRNAIRTIIG